MKGEQAGRHAGDGTACGTDARGTTACGDVLDNGAVRVVPRGGYRGAVPPLRAQIEQVIAQLHQFRLDIAREQLAAMAPEGPEPNLAHQHHGGAGQDEHGEGDPHLLHDGHIHAAVAPHRLDDGHRAGHAGQRRTSRCPPPPCRAHRDGGTAQKVLKLDQTAGRDIHNAATP